MKKRLRQVQLDMTKLRARQAEVAKEVQNSPAVGEPLFLVVIIFILVVMRQFAYMDSKYVPITTQMVITILFVN